MNIELHGFDQNVAGRLIDEIWERLIARFNTDVELSQFVVTSVPVITREVRGRTVPFFRIYFDQQDHFQTVLGLLREIGVPRVRGVRIFIECIPLHHRLFL